MSRSAPQHGTKRRRVALLLLWLALVIGGAGGARANTVVADLSSHIVAITSGFTGTSVVLFGATYGPGDNVAVERGPEERMKVWRKGKVAGIWVNAESIVFSNVPSFYAVAASRPLDEVLAPAPAALYRIGTDNLKLETRRTVTPEIARRYADALVVEQQRSGLYASEVGRIAFLGERLFRAAIEFPANVPTGTYLVEIFLVRDRDVVSGQTTPLIVSKVGVDAAVSDFASRQAAAYGAIAVATALMAGWLASLPFRGT